MNRKWQLIAIALALIVGACNDLGLGEADCTPPERGVSSANILTVQAVPEARYTPCLNQLKLGWDSVQWFAEDGRAGIEIYKSTSPFLTATVTASCELGSAVPALSGVFDIERFEDVEFETAAIGITIVPSGDLPLLSARRLVDRLGNTRLEDRSVEFEIDDALDESTGGRLERALARGRYVWIIDQLDHEEGTVELRSNDPRVVGSGLSPENALDEIEDHLPDMFYRGSWYFTFDGGCITYEFDAEGTLAETVAQDAEDALGFYPAHELRAIAESAGYELVVEEPAD